MYSSLTQARTAQYILQLNADREPATLKPAESEEKVMAEMIRNIGSVLVIKMRVVNMVKRNNEYTFDNNIRTNPYYSEFAGMTQLLKAMDIEYEIDWNEDVTQMTAITIMGIRFEV